MPRETLSCVISGSFKFKPEIDGLYDEMEENGIRVLAPDKGWLYVSLLHVVRRREFASYRPLPTELGMTPGEIEKNFLRHLRNASFVYLHNLEGYIGEMTAFELGQAVAIPKPIYAREELDFTKSGFEDISHFMLLRDVVRVVPIPEIEQDYYQQCEVSSPQTAQD